MTNVLFVGSLCHGTRINISEPLPSACNVAKPVKLTIEYFTDPYPDTMQHFTYHLRQFRDPTNYGQPSPVYVDLTDLTVYGTVHTADGRLADALLRELDYQRLPTCFAPNCTDKARTRFIAMERGRLGGQHVEPEQEIRLCGRHAHDIYLATGAYGREQLAEWLQGDDNLDPLDAYDIGHASWHEDQDRMIAYRARVLRMKQSDGSR